jgi:hypothetical protein
MRAPAQHRRRTPLCGLLRTRFGDAGAPGEEGRWELRGYPLGALPPWEVLAAGRGDFFGGD